MNDFERKTVTEFRSGEPLKVFRASMEELAAKEKAAGHAHFDELFNPDDLDDSDMEMYRKYQRGQLSIPEIQSRVMDIDRKLNKSQKLLNAYLANKLNERALDQG